MGGVTSLQGERPGVCSPWSTTVVYCWSVASLNSTHETLCIGLHGLLFMPGDRRMTVVVIVPNLFLPKTMGNDLYWVHSNHSKLGDTG